MPYTIRPAQNKDIDALCALEIASFPSDRLSRRQMKYHLHNKNVTFLVCAESKTNDILGYALMFFHASRPARLYSVAVDKKAQGQGIGKSLIERLIHNAIAKQCTAMTLEVRTVDKKTVALYERLGFEKIRTISSYYEDGANAFKMIRKI